MDVFEYDDNGKKCLFINTRIKVIDTQLDSIKEACKKYCDNSRDYCFTDSRVINLNYPLITENSKYDTFRFEYVNKMTNTRAHKRVIVTEQQLFVEQLNFDNF